MCSFILWTNIKRISLDEKKHKERLHKHDLSNSMEFLKQKRKTKRNWAGYACLSLSQWTGFCQSSLPIVHSSVSVCLANQLKYIRRNVFNLISFHSRHTASAYLHLYNVHVNMCERCCACNKSKNSTLKIQQIQLSCRIIFRSFWIWRDWIESHTHTDAVANWFASI